MSFASPAFLAALAIVPLALLAHSMSRRRARRYAVRYPGVATLAPLSPLLCWSQCRLVSMERPAPFRES